MRNKDLSSLSNSVHVLIAALKTFPAEQKILYCNSFSSMCMYTIDPFSVQDARNHILLKVIFRFGNEMGKTHLKHVKPKKTGTRAGIFWSVVSSTRLVSRYHRIGG